MDSPHAIGLFLGPAEISPWLEDVARLRIGVFRAWPYLYEGSLESEREYLAAYARSKDCLFVLAFDDGKVIGASTGLPLADDTQEFHRPFVERGMPVESVFYFGESVLLPEYRGRGIGHAFFDQREAHARALGRFRWTAFCSVDRDIDDVRRPDGYRTNDAFWSKRGYQRRPGMTMHLPWQEAGHGDVVHPLTFWLRELEQAA